MRHDVQLSTMRAWAGGRSLGVIALLVLISAGIGAGLRARIASVDPPAIGRAGDTCCAATCGCPHEEPDRACCCSTESTEPSPAPVVASELRAPAPNELVLEIAAANDHVPRETSLGPRSCPCGEHPSLASSVGTSAALAGDPARVARVTFDTSWRPAQIEQPRLDLRREPEIPPPRARSSQA